VSAPAVVKPGTTVKVDTTFANRPGATRPGSFPQSPCSDVLTGEAGGANFALIRISPSPHCRTRDPRSA
jgi:hypothetical protein